MGTLAAVDPNLGRFDHAAVLAAAELCERTARQIADLDQQRHRLATRATDDSRGPWRAHFERAIADANTRSAATQRSLLQAATALRAASHAALAPAGSWGHQ